MLLKPKAFLQRPFLCSVLHLIIISYRPRKGRDSHAKFHDMTQYSPEFFQTIPTIAIFAMFYVCILIFNILTS